MAVAEGRFVVKREFRNWDIIAWGEGGDDNKHEDADFWFGGLEIVFKIFFFKNKLSMM